MATLRRRSGLRLQRATAVTKSLQQFRQASAGDSNKLLVSHLSSASYQLRVHHDSALAASIRDMRFPAIRPFAFRTSAANYRT